MQRVLAVLALILSLAALATSAYVAAPTTTAPLAPGEVALTTGGLFPPDQKDIAHHLGIIGQRFILNGGDRAFRADLTYEVWRKGQVIQTNELSGTETREGQIQLSLSLPRHMHTAGKKEITVTYVLSDETGSLAGELSLPFEDVEQDPFWWIPTSGADPVREGGTIVCGLAYGKGGSAIDYRNCDLAFVFKAKIGKNEFLK
jgi:hypothetical protein